jgi:hypothetical protein
VYSQANIEQNSHKLEVTLEPSALYYCGLSSAFFRERKGPDHGLEQALHETYPGNENFECGNRGSCPRPCRRGLLCLHHAAARYARSPARCDRIEMVPVGKLAFVASRERATRAIYEMS